MSTYTGSAFATKYAAYLIYKGSATAAALNISQPKIGYVYDITEGGTLTPGNITVQQGDAVVYLAQGWTHCNNGGADQVIANLSSQFDELLEEIGETDFSKFALKTELPTVPGNVSAFTNDAGYLTEHQSLANYALKTDIPNVSNLAPYSAIPQNVSQLTNDAHYLTEAVVNDRVRKVDDLAQDTDAADGEIVQLTTDGRFYRFTEPQAEGESGTWTTINQPADIASDDQILSQNNSGKLTATLGMSYNSTNQHLELKGNNGAVVAYVDMAVFIKDGMLENVEKYTTPEQGVTVAVPYLKFTFNTDSGKSVIRISFADLIDTFDGSNVDLTSAFVKATTYSAPAIGDSMDVAIGKLLKGHEDNAAAISGKQDTLTFDDAPQSGSNRPVTSQGIKSAIDAVASTAAQGLKCVDLTTYSGGVNGEIVKHTGADTAQYTNGYDYKLTLVEQTIPSGTEYCVVNDTSGELVKVGIPNGTYYEITDADDEVANNFVWHARKLGNPVDGTAPIYEELTEGYYESFITIGEYALYDDKFLKVTGLRNLNERGGISTTNPTTILEFEDGTEVAVSGGSSGSETPEPVSNIRIFEDAEGHRLYRRVYYSSIFAVQYLHNAYRVIGLWDKSGTMQWNTTSESTVVRFEQWQRINVQPSSEGAVSDLESRMTAAETAIQGKQDEIIVTASKVLGSDASGKVAATSIATTDAEDAVSKRHTQNTDTKIVSGNNKVEVSASGTAITGNGSVSGDLSVSGNLNVTGKETVEEIVNIKSENNFITLRDGAQTAVASGDISGTKVENYDGLGNDLLFGTDASGTFRIGDDGGTLEPIATRDEAANLTDGQLMKWDATNQRLVGTSDIQTQLNTKRVYFGTSDTTASTAIKVITTDADFPTTTVNGEIVPLVGVVICIKPSVSDEGRSAQLMFQVGNCKALPVWYNNSEFTLIASSTLFFSANRASSFVFDGTYWQWVSSGIDNNTTYSVMSVSEGKTGTATSPRTVNALNLQQIIHGQIDKFVGTRAMTEDAYWDLVTAGTVQADTLYITFDNDWEG